jgi:hypothetical protein
MSDDTTDRTRLVEQAKFLLDESTQDDQDEMLNEMLVRTHPSRESQLN